VILLDTNVLSELMKAAPAESVLRWFSNLPANRLYTTSITQAEMLHGILLLPPGRRRSAFEAAAAYTAQLRTIQLVGLRRSLLRFLIDAWRCGWGNSLPVCPSAEGG
jgi:predicted nucleic acid-binding protein